VGLDVWVVDDAEMSVVPAGPEEPGSLGSFILELRFVSFDFQTPVWWASNGLGNRLQRLRCKKFRNSEEGFPPTDSESLNTLLQCLSEWTLSTACAAHIHSPY
jgi:hypothetical protein